MTASSDSPTHAPAGAPLRITPRSTRTEVRAALEPALHVRRWLDDVAAQAPFPSFVHLLDAAVAGADPLSEAEIDEALADHPRLGEAHPGSGAAAEFSRVEQQAADDIADGLAGRLAAGNAAYEQRFGRVFLVRAAGRSRAEILGELDRRLQLDEAAELQEVAEQLREITLLRVGQLWQETP